MSPAPAFQPFDQAPFLVLWELTRACDLACRHCRAEAVTHRDPEELSLDEARGVLRQIRDMGTLLVVLTGGDPLKSPSVFDIISEGARLGLRMTLTPSATPLLTREAVCRMKEAGLSRMAVSLDACDAPRHDAFRGVRGSFDRTFHAIEAAHEASLPVQINTTLCRANYDQFDEMAGLVERAKAVLWSVFFVVPVGRAGFADELSADEFEALFGKMARLAEKAPFDIKSTAAPHFRRHLLQRQRGASPRRIVGLPQPSEMRAPRGVNDANGLLFISHTGEVYPSGFLPISAGNVRELPLAKIYRESDLFVALRDPDRLGGKCGVCLYRKVCGGSRARAYAFTGDPLAAEPCCSFIPEGYQQNFSC